MFKIALFARNALGHNEPKIAIKIAILGSSGGYKNSGSCYPCDSKMCPMQVASQDGARQDTFSTLAILVL